MALTLKRKNPKKQEKVHEDAFPSNRRRRTVFRVLFQQTNKQINKQGRGWSRKTLARVGGSAAVREGASTPATPTQHDKMFGANDAAAVVEEDVDYE